MEILLLQLHFKGYTCTAFNFVVCTPAMFCNGSVVYKSLPILFSASHTVHCENIFRYICETDTTNFDIQTEIFGTHLLEIHPGNSNMQLVILATLVVLVCSSVSTLQFTKYITPDSSTGCPDERYCYSLQEIIHNTRVYFTSNTTLRFLSGKYTVKTESSVVVSDVTELAIVGSNNTIIQCFEKFGFVFLNVSNLTVQHLHFTHCGLNVFSRGLKNIANTLTDVTDLIRYQFIPMQNLHSSLYFVQVYHLNINRVIVNNSKGCGILGINILGNSSVVYTSFSGNMFNAVFIYQDPARDTSAYSVAAFSALAIVNSNFKMGVTKFKYTAGGLTLALLQKSYHVSILINNATFQENKGFTCSSIYIGTSECSSIDLKMNEVTIAGGVCSIKDSSLKRGEVLFLYRKRTVSCKKTMQTLSISRGNFSRNSQSLQSKQIQHPSIHITPKRNIPVSVFVNMKDIILTDNMGSGLCINNIISPVILQSVFISGNLNGAVEIHHSNFTFIGATNIVNNGSSKGG